MIGPHTDRTEIVHQDESESFAEARRRPPSKPRRRVARPPVHRPVRHRPTHIRLAAYLQEIFRRGLRSYTMDFDRLSNRLEVSRRTLERAVARLRNGQRFFWATVRVGRSFAVTVSDRQSYNKGVFFASRKKEIKTPRREAPDIKSAILPIRPELPPAGAYRDLAAWLARHPLALAHWDNCKVAWRFPHAFSFALDALKRGHPKSAIITAYTAALHRRHQDATDVDLNGSKVRAIWEPSSTVSLARTQLGLPTKRISPPATARHRPDRNRLARCGPRAPAGRRHTLRYLLSRLDAKRLTANEPIDAGSVFLGFS